MTGLFAGKRVLVFGLANERSIAWGIAQAMQAQGAEFIFTYAGDALEKRVRPLAEELGVQTVLPCDVTSDEAVDQLFAEVEKRWPDGFDVLIHSIAFANREDLDGRFVETSRAGFALAMDVSAYSLVLLARKSEPLLAKRKGSIVTLTYYGAEKWMPHYNVMGVAKAALEASVRYLAADLGEKQIRVNAISAGPIKTLAASGIGDFRYILKWNEYNAPLRRTVTIEEVGETAAFLLSPMSRGITGEILHVDGGLTAGAF
jgi:enoyl-[acyl-carrier protein] reductase I